MNDILEQLKDRHAKAKARLEKAEKALESARSEFSDIETALRVLQEMQGIGASGGVKSVATEVVAERQSNILKVLREGRNSALEPKELYVYYSLTFGDDVSLDTFRTTIWRMKDRGPFADGETRWTVENEDGRYWKERIPQDYDDIF
ncbi:hypothetical protein ACLBKT_03420 [Erythrobacter sp. W302b]|uniref:hypothetical protein n=1 Tax=Erythrobacter sp. W302b TaxID=3389874 RepID=UPI00396B4332